MENVRKYYANRDVISLFSGAMGLDIGLSNAGLNVVIGQDFDKACVATMRANNKKVLGGINPLLCQVGNLFFENARLDENAVAYNIHLFVFLLSNSFQQTQRLQVLKSQQRLK